MFISCTSTHPMCIYFSQFIYPTTTPTPCPHPPPTQQRSPMAPNHKSQSDKFTTTNHKYIYIYIIEASETSTIFHISTILKKKKKRNNPILRPFPFTMLYLPMLCHSLSWWSSFSNTNSAKSNSVFLLQMQIQPPSPSFNSFIETQLPLLFIVSPNPSLSQSVTCLCSPMKNTNMDTNLLSRSVFFV